MSTNDQLKPAIPQDQAQQAEPVTHEESGLCDVCGGGYALKTSGLCDHCNQPVLLPWLLEMSVISQGPQTRELFRRAHHYLVQAARKAVQPTATPGTESAGELRRALEMLEKAAVDSCFIHAEAMPKRGQDAWALVDDAIELIKAALAAQPAKGAGGADEPRHIFEMGEKAYLRRYQVTGGGMDMFKRGYLDGFLAAQSTPAPQGQAVEALKALYSFPGVRELLAPKDSLGSIAAQVEAVLSAPPAAPDAPAGEATWGEPELEVMARMAKALEEIERQTKRMHEGEDRAYSAVGTIALWECKESLRVYREWKRKPKLRPAAPAGEVQRVKDIAFACLKEAEDCEEKCTNTFHGPDAEPSASQMTLAALRGIMEHRLGESTAALQSQQPKEDGK